MTEKTDLSDEELERLAEFCGADFNFYDLHDDPLSGVEAYHFEYKEIPESEWQPHSFKSEQWQIHAILEAVEGEGLVNKVRDEFIEHHDKGGYTISSWDFMKAHPAQICRAVLSVIEGDDS